MFIKVIKDSIIYKGEIKALNKEFECDNAIAASLIERGYAEAVGEVDEAKLVGHLDPADLETYSYQELKKLAADLGVSANGKKEELIERIAALEVEVEAEAVLDELPEGEEPAEGIDADELPFTEMPE